MKPSLLHPRYWGVWFALGLLRLTVWLPYRSAMGLGRMIGRLACRLAHRRRRIAEINLQLCFPERDDAWRAGTLRRHFESLGMALIETGFCWWASERKLWPLRYIQGQEYLREAVERGKGVLLLSAHFTSVEMGGRLLLLDTPIDVMYRPHDNPVFEHVMGGSRDRISEKAIPKEAVRDLLRSLKGGRVVWYAPDQKASGLDKGSIFVKFFGQTAATKTATAKLATMSGAAVVPFKAVRRDDGHGYDLRIEPMLEDYPSGDEVADTQRINDILEGWIRENPEQYLWVHRRFQWQPDRSAPTPYDGV